MVIKQFPFESINDDTDICMLMARTDASVLADWRGKAAEEYASQVKEKKVILVVDDDTGIMEYMEQLPDGSLKSMPAVSGEVK
jgi:hypothetical protein